jgi:hypothetical protein
MPTYLAILLASDSAFLPLGVYDIPRESHGGR